jgi:SAM-dependent methyltransferase
MTTQTQEFRNVTHTNAGPIEAWNGVLFDKFRRFRDTVVGGLAIHGDRLLARAAPRKHEHVLDLGCGFGDTTRQLAALAGRAVGMDCAPRFIATADADARAAAIANVSFFVADAQTDDLRGVYDLAYSRFGTMFFASPVAALKNVRRHLAPGGRLAMVVWRKREDNPWLFDAQCAVRAILPEDVEDKSAVTCGPGPFSMASADLVSTQLIAAGFEDIAFERYDALIRIGSSIEEATEIAMELGPAGEIVRLAGETGQRRKPEIIAALHDVWKRYARPDGIYAPSSTWLVTARARL